MSAGDGKSRNKAEQDKIDDLERQCRVERNALSDLQARAAVAKAKQDASVADAAQWNDALRAQVCWPSHELLARLCSPAGVFVAVAVACWLALASFCVRMRVCVRSQLERKRAKLAAVREDSGSVLSQLQASVASDAAASNTQRLEELYTAIVKKRLAAK